MVEALTIIDNRPKRRARKRESQILEKIGCIVNLIKTGWLRYIFFNNMEE